MVNIQGYFGQGWGGLKIGAILMSKKLSKETCMDEHRTPVNTQAQVRDTQEREAGTEHLEHK